MVIGLYTVICARWVDRYCRTDCEISGKYAPCKLLSRERGGGLWWPAGLLFGYYIKKIDLLHLLLFITNKEINTIIS